MAMTDHWGDKKKKKKKIIGGATAPPPRRHCKKKIIGGKLPPRGAATVCTWLRVRCIYSKEPITETESDQASPNKKSIR